MENNLHKKILEEQELVHKIERINQRIKEEKSTSFLLNETEKATFAYREWRVRQLENEKQTLIMRLTQIRQDILLLTQKIKRVRSGEMS